MKEIITPYYALLKIIQLFSKTFFNITKNKRDISSDKVMIQLVYIYIYILQNVSNTYFIYTFYYLQIAHKLDI